jgi:hypothetical protein
MGENSPSKMITPTPHPPALTLSEKEKTQLWGLIVFLKDIVKIQKLRDETSNLICRSTTITNHWSCKGVIFI